MSEEQNLGDPRAVEAPVSTPKSAVGRHTPGPWFAGPLQSMDEYGGPGGVSVGTYDLFEAYGGRPDYAPGLFDDHCEDQIALVSGCNHDAVANARLIAAAPDLLDALQRIASATPANTNSSTAARMASWTRAVAATAVAEAAGSSDFHITERRA